VIKRLHELAEIQIGWQHKRGPGGANRHLDFSKREDLEEFALALQNVCWIIQVRDIDDRGRLDKKNMIGGQLPSDARRKMMERYYLQPEDLLFIYRGSRTVATHLNSLVPGQRYVATSHFYTIRVNTAVADPRYVAWSLNQPRAQTWIAEHAVGSGIKMIPKQVFETIEIPLPTRETQCRLVELDELRRQEADLMKRLTERRTVMIAALGDRAARTAKS
jgi:hypothetical protein